ncbi:hypothetical protein QJS04_geneDACA023196 [Acorus gramineus]|uniref:Uncharacterized protein n=1 Tax=Acorus gramineus TaxID=55184 RepID=A0AAV9BTR4_ACOGR|nr:hypothetical protein QJS04_geneDACA023196 [Acorus gramineus]
MPGMKVTRGRKTIQQLYGLPGAMVEEKSTDTRPNHTLNEQGVPPESALWYKQLEATKCFQTIRHTTMAVQEFRILA